MLKKPKSESNSLFECNCSIWHREICSGEPFYGEFEGKRYCVLHFPSSDKEESFKEAFKKKIRGNDLSFSGVWFPPNSSFTNVRSNTNADFDYATFDGDAFFLETHFSGGASFNHTTFRGAARFGAANFEIEGSFFDCTFTNVAEFRYARFKNAHFNRSVFGAEADFSETIFEGEADFDHVIFNDRVRFAQENKIGGTTKDPEFDFQFARFDKPSHAVFHTMTLRPNWFANVDARIFQFTNVRWAGSIKDEIKSLKSKRVLSPHRILAIACRQLASNSEENHQYEDASKLRYLAMDARRRETWRGFDVRRLSWWYWLASGYGERPSQAVIVLIGVLLVSSLLYTRAGFVRWEPRLASEADAIVAQKDVVGAPLKLSRALTYSAGVMTLQKPEPRPATTAAQTIVLFETILGPVQAALLALAIRRKFMR
jgi:hypothetical protein